MEKLSLSWNSRTPKGRITKDKEFGKIADFIKNGKSNEWILNFCSYDNDESREFLRKLKTILKEEINDNNLRFECLEISFFYKRSKRSPGDGLLKKMNSTEELFEELGRIPEHESGVVMLYEPIDYGYKISEHKDLKYKFHKKLAGIFEKNNLFLFLFGNIPYDIHHFEENSPLSKFVLWEYHIREYKKEELNPFKSLKSNLGKIIMNNSKGNFQLISSLESFWKEIKLEKRVNELLNNFLEVPLKSNKDKLVYRKLAGLSHFLENNKNEVGDEIKIEKDKITIEKGENTEIFKDYFDKTALFKCDEIDDGINTHYELTPKDIFIPTIETSGFIRNKGKMLTPLENIDEYSDVFEQITTYLDTSTSNPIFFLGAGNSLTSGAPDKKKMFQDILKKVKFREKSRFDGMSYEELKKEFQELVKSGYRRDSLLSIVRDQLHDLKPSIGHFHLSQLVKEKKFKVLITTNFDTLLEDSLMDYGVRSKEFIRLVANEKMTAYEWRWTNKFPELLKILKICGDIYYGSWLAVDDESAKKWIRKAISVMNKINAYRDTDFFIILGHKFEEVDLSKIFNKKNKDELTIIYANPDESDCNKFLDNYSSYSENIKTIKGYYGEFDNFMQELCRRLLERGKLD